MRTRWGQRRGWKLSGLGLVGLVLVLACGEPPPQELARAVEDDAEAGSTALSSEPSQVASGDELDLGRTGLQLQPWAQGSASVASDGADLYLAVWRDERSGGIFGTRVNTAGKVLEPTGLVLNPSARGFGPGGPVSVAFTGTHFLVVWLDDVEVFAIRLRRDGTRVDPEAVFLRQIDSGGEPSIACDGAGRCLVTVLDIGGDEESSVDALLVTDGPGSLAFESFGVAAGQLGQPRVAWSGRHFLVVWPEEREGSSDVLGARVTPEGTVLDSPGFVISSASGEQREPSVGRMGDRMWVVWEDTRRGESDIFGTRVRDAEVLDRDGLALSTATGRQHEARVASVSGRAFVLWTHEGSSGRSRIRGTRVTADGTVINRAGFPVSAEDFAREENANLACGSAQCFVAYQSPSPADDASGFARSRFVLGTRLTRGEGALDSPALELSKAAPAQRFPAVAWGEDSFLVVWQEFRDVEGPTLVAARIRPDGRVLDRRGIELPGAPGSTSPAVAFDGHEFLVVWQEPHPGGEDIRGARVSASGRLLDRRGIPISTARVRQLSPSVAGGDGRFFVAWEDTRDGELDNLRFTPFGARVGGNGRVLDPAGIRLAPPDRFGLEPDVVHMGDRFLVAWSGGGRIEGTRVAYDGTVMDPAGLALSPPTPFFEASPALSFDGTTALAVWTRFGTEIIGTRVTPEGAIVGTPGFTIVEVPPEGGFVGLPDATFDGVQHQVVWMDTRSPASPLNPLSIRGARVATDGTVLDPGGVPLLTELFNDFTTPPAIAADGEGHSLLAHVRFIEDPDVHSFRLVGRLLGRDWSGQWRFTGPMGGGPRAGHIAALLPDGKVLVAGGHAQKRSFFLSSAEVYDPRSDTWRSTGSMVEARHSARAVLLPDGKVLVVGGEGFALVLATAELYDPVSGTWRRTGPMRDPREGHTATLLPNGKVLVAGGLNLEGTLATAELYDPASGTWRPTGSMVEPREGHTATLLLNGKVLVAGGTTAELYDPASGTWSPTGAPLEPLSGPATLLLDGRVLVAGGTTAQVYDPASGTWSATGAPLEPLSGPATLLLDGRVLVAGGTTAELYDPASGTWSVTNPMAIPRAGHTATRLRDGRVLVAGTPANTEEEMESAELYTPGPP
ncbi:hypothetical protein NR798_07695 [Archangium gephyra]|uniref:Kelch repeat-containing protein n=1 Tax=Archangium gephyra TaxID=48 RepID=UPI0035D5083D